MLIQYILIYLMLSVFILICISPLKEVSFRLGKPSIIIKSVRRLDKMELYPSEFEVRVVEVEKEIDWIRYEHETGEVRGKALNKAYEMAMRLWDVDEGLSQKYVRILNNISNESLGRRLNRTPHYGYYR